MLAIYCLLRNYNDIQRTHTHTHTQTNKYIYIYIYILLDQQFVIEGLYTDFANEFHVNFLLVHVQCNDVSFSRLIQILHNWLAQSAWAAEYIEYTSAER